MRTILDVNITSLSISQCRTSCYWNYFRIWTYDNLTISQCYNFIYIRHWRGRELRLILPKIWVLGCDVWRVTDLGWSMVCSLIDCSLKWWRISRLADQYRARGLSREAMCWQVSNSWLDGSFSSRSQWVPDWSPLSSSTPPPHLQALTSPPFSCSFKTPFNPPLQLSNQRFSGR